MNKTEVKRVKIYGHMYHLVVGKVRKETRDTRWRKEILGKFFHNQNPFYIISEPYDFHHIGGRVGCLRWLVENGVIVNRAPHMMEKSLDSRERSKFHHEIQKLVGKKRYGEMVRIKNWYRYVGNGHDMPPK